MLFKFAQESVFVGKQTLFCALSALNVVSWLTRRKERALVPIKSKLVVAVCKVDFSEITLMRNGNVMWAGGNGW